MIAKGKEARHAGADTRRAPGEGATTRRMRDWLMRLSATAALTAGLFLPCAACGGQQSSSPASQAEQQERQVDASRAAKDVDVGTFYMHKGDYGAAISRLEEAVQLDPQDGKARLLLAESYEKQHNWSEALKTYRKYLRDFPNARDDKKIRKKIQELSRRRD
jgi:cytochrome c-type biogenesis protein CcmH/NrfG